MQEAIELQINVWFCPLGWYTGRTSENTRKLVVEEGGFYMIQMITVMIFLSGAK